MSKCPDKAWDGLTALAHARAASKAREAELVQTRKSLENELDELGAGDSAKHMRVSRDYVVTLRGIEYERDRIKTLADSMDTVIAQALQGKFEFAEEIDEQSINRRPKESDLFERPSEEKVADSKPVGRPGRVKPETPDPSKAEGVDQHLSGSVNELDIRDDLKSRLVKAGLTRIGHVTAILDTDGDLREVANLNENQFSAVRAAVNTASAYKARSTYSHRHTDLSTSGVSAL